MGLSGCYAVIKYLMVFINFIFWVLGFAVVILAIWMLTEPVFYISMIQDETNYTIGLYIFLAAGILMLIVAFLGCCGAFKESQCMLISFFGFLLIILVVEVASGVWAYTNSDQLETKIRKAVAATVQEEYGKYPTHDETFDAIQRNLKCCGANGPRDWNGSNYNKKDKTGLHLTLTQVIQHYNIPESCCQEGTDPTVCKDATKIGIGASILSVVYTQGCVDKVVDHIKDNMSTVAGVAIAIIAIEVLAIIFALILCFAVKHSDRYKA